MKGSSDELLEQNLNFFFFYSRDCETWTQRQNLEPKRLLKPSTPDCGHCFCVRWAPSLSKHRFSWTEGLGIQSQHMNH